MNLTGYGHRLSVSHLVTAIVERGLDVAGFLLNSGGPLPMSDVHVRRCAAELTEIRKLLQDGRGHGKDVGERAEWPSGANQSTSPTSPSSTSAAPVAHSPSPVDAAEQPRADRAPHSGEDRPGQPNVEDIPDEYWDGKPNGYTVGYINTLLAENALLRQQLDTARNEAADATAPQPMNEPVNERNTE